MDTGTLKGLKESIEEQITQGDIKLALNRLRAYLGDSNTNLRRSVILLSARHSELLTNRAAGLVVNYDREIAEIRANLLALIDQLPDHTTGMPEMAIVVTLPEAVGLEAIVGTSNLQQVAWIEHGLHAAKSVCRILTPNKNGTGFLIAQNLLMTNHHVIPSRELAEQTKAEFNYQQDIHGNFLQRLRFDLDTSRFHTNPDLDYTIVGLQPDSSDMDGKNFLQECGWLMLNASANPVAQEHVVIIQHAGGGMKQIALTANQVVSTWENLLHYTTDTMPGSSGSPVFNDSWQVIAIHHAGGRLQTNSHGDRRFVNEGVLMSAIRRDAGPYWPGA